MTATPRLRGRAGVTQRQRRRAMFPLCAECQSIGIIRATAEIDHIIPLSIGGADEDDNCQGLCAEHHAIKSALEDTAHQAAANHPAWLKPSRIPLTIISGPPCSGKTTYVQNNAHPADTVIDLDGIMMRLRPGYQHWSGQLDKTLINAAIRVRNAMLGSLSRASMGRAWFIVSAPSPDERTWWRVQLGGDLLLLHPGKDECKRRAIARNTPRAVEGIDTWEAASRRPWRPSGQAARQTIGPDGWPVSNPVT